MSKRFRLYSSEMSAGVCRDRTLDVNMNLKIYAACIVRSHSGVSFVDGRIFEKSAEGGTLVFYITFPFLSLVSALA